MSVDQKEQREERTSASDRMLKEVENSIVLLHGVFDDGLFDLLKTKKDSEIFVMEGRPSLESAQVTCKALLERKVRPTLIADNMAGFLFYKRLVREVWLAYQSVDDKGALCPIGSLILGVLGKRHDIPVHLFPASRESKLMGNQKDIFYFNGVKVAPAHIKGYVPLMEWLPKKYITEIHNT